MREDNGYQDKTKGCMKRVWNDEKNALMRRLYPTAHLGSLAARLGVTEKALRSRAKVMGLKRRVNKKHPWTQRQIAYLTKHYADTPIDVLIVKTKHDQKSIWNKAKALGLRKSREFLAEVGRKCSQHPRSIATRFIKGQEPANKGKRIEEFMTADGIRRSSQTRFKKGQLPHNTKPIGYERVDEQARTKESSQRMAECTRPSPEDETRHGRTLPQAGDSSHG